MNQTSRHFDTVIFDIDGTLLDSVTQHAEAWSRAFAQFGHTVSVEAARGQIGKGGDKLLPEFLDEDTVAREGKQIDSARSELFKTEYLPHIQPFRGVRDLVARLQADGVKVALASSGKADDVQVYKRIAGIDDLMKTEVSSEDVKASKPDPDIFAAAMERLSDPDPARTLVIGDAPYDAEAAAKLRLKPVGVLSGGFTEADLKAAGCVAIYRDVADILARYDTLEALA